MAGPATQPNTNSTEPWQAKGGEKRVFVQGMFGQIAPTYDRVNRILSFNSDRGWRRKALDLIQVKPGDFALDLCCGTGDFLTELRARGASVVGVDFCRPMIELARPKIDGKNQLAVGDACQIPLQSGQFDVVTVGWGIRNVPDIDLAHREIFRVLKPGGRFASVDMAIPSNPIIAAISNWSFRRLVPILGQLFKSREAYTYLPESTQLFMTREQLKSSMESAGFKDIRYQNLRMGNICIHWGTKP